MPIAISKDLSFIADAVLRERIRAFDVAGAILSIEKTSRCWGSFSDVFVGSIRLNNNSKVDVALKRLRVPPEFYNQVLMLRLAGHDDD